MNFFIFLLFLFVLPGANAQKIDSKGAAIARAGELEIWKHPQWLRLNHYEPSVFGGVSSAIADSSFFLAPKGRRDPKAEAIAQIESLFETDSPNDPNQKNLCRFPLRRSFLIKELNLTPPEDSSSCELYQRYRKNLNAAGVSFVFSSYYTNNPGSAFGHTFFRIHQKGEPGQPPPNELLDHGIGYAAVVTTENPLLYAIFGIAGWFRGSFTNVPYYYKVREYNDFESRDLWAYELDLQPKELSDLVDHLWEVGNVGFDYYFFTRNCAYHMLTAIEAAAPRFSLSNDLPLWVIPADALRAVSRAPGLVNGVQFRPSIRSTFYTRLSLMNPTQRSLFSLYHKTYDPNLIQELPEKEKVELVDAAIDSIDFKFPEKVFQPNSEAARKKNKLLSQRAALPTISNPLVVPPPWDQRPDKGHESSRISFGGSFDPSDTSQNSSLLEMRFALHDLLDPSEGYPRFSQIEFFHFRAKKNLTTGNVELLDQDFFQAATLSPLNEFSTHLSWKGRLGAYAFDSNICDPRCLAPGTSGAMGYAFSVLPNENWIFYGMAEIGAYYDSHFKQRGFMGRLGPQVGTLVQLTPWSRFFLQHTLYSLKTHAQDFDKKTELEARIKISTNNQIAIRSSWADWQNVWSFLAMHSF